LRDRRDLVDTSPDITSTYEGRLYQFSSVEAKTAFDAEPEKYAPAHGGADVIIQTNSHQAVDGTLDHAVWFRDKLYLFSSSESLEAFVLNPGDYAREER
jgi:YHS domain-containing protein